MAQESMMAVWAPCLITSATPTSFLLFLHSLSPLAPTSPRLIFSPRPLPRLGFLSAPASAQFSRHPDPIDSIRLNSLTQQITQQQSTRVAHKANNIHSRGGRRARQVNNIWLQKGQGNLRHEKQQDSARARAHS